MSERNLAGAAEAAADADRAWIEIDLDALVRNARALQRRAARPLVPMVKADGYGIGAVETARALSVATDVAAFGVATVDEGAALRSAGITHDIIVFTPLAAAELPRAREAKLTPALSRSESIGAWQGSYHLAIDTGMSRAGVDWRDIGTIAEAARANRPAAVFTHFHTSCEGSSASEQMQRFHEARAALDMAQVPWHAANSGGIARGIGVDDSLLVRPGVALYGGPAGDMWTAEPVVALRARVVDARRLRAGDSVSYDATWAAASETFIATVAAGYGDGYPRSAGNRATAALGGRRAAVRGNVTMDMIMLDAGDDVPEIGTVADLLGGSGPSLAELAASAGISSYELLTRLRMRLPRRYIGRTS